MRRELYLFAAALLFVSGNLTAGYICDCTADTDSQITSSVIFLSCITAAATLAAASRKLPSVRILLFPLLGATGIAAHVFFRPGPEISTLQVSRSTALTGTITDGGISSSGRPFLEVELGPEKTVIYNTPENMLWMPGDTLAATGLICSRVENFTPDFDYRRWMQKQRVFYTCFCNADTELEVMPSYRTPVRNLPARLRKEFSEAVDKVIPGDDMATTRAVVKALAYGYQDEIPDQIENSFRESGAIHLLALSGMHLGLLYGILSRLLLVLGNSVAARRIKSILIISALWTFTVFTGCGVSILRAAVMFTVYEAGALAGRAGSGINSMSISAIIITVADPDAPSGISFQLSYAAMTAIFLIYPHLHSLVPIRRKLFKSIADICSMTLACQITTAPIIYLHFGTFAFFSLLANLLCSPLITIIMVLIPCTFAAPWFGGGAVSSITWAISFLIKTFIDINTVISDL